MDLPCAREIYRYAMEAKTDLAEKMRESLCIIEEILNLYPNEFSTSFNGGKDSMVVFQLVRAALVHRQEYDPHKLALFDIDLGPGSEFPEMLKFVSDLICNNEATLLVYNARGINTEYNGLKYTSPLNSENMRGVELMKELLKAVIHESSSKAIFMGVRKSDPQGKYLGLVTPSTQDWPQMFRVCPILNWSFVDVWDFLLRFNVPFCELYLRGYTSLGSPDKTIPSPFLKRGKCIENSTYQALKERGIYIEEEVMHYSEEYLPAFFLPLNVEERSNRIH